MGHASYCTISGLIETSPQDITFGPLSLLEELSRIIKEVLVLLENETTLDSNTIYSFS